MRLRVELPEGTTEWESDVALFRVGRADTCALRFEGAAAKYSSWEHAEFRRDDDGNTYVADLESSNGTYLDGKRIAEPTPLWVGAVVQIGTKGPKLEVLELTAPACGAGVSPAGGVGVSSAQQPGRPHHKLARHHLAVVTIAGLFVAVLGFSLLRKGEKSPPPPEPPIAASVPEVPPQGGGNEEKSGAAGPGKTKVQQPENQPPPPPPPPDPWKVAKAAALPGYRLIAIEDPKIETTWPYAGAVVIGPQALLTTADVGVELARRRQQGMNVKVLRHSQDIGVPVDGVRVYAPFQQEAPEEQLYFDMAILSTAERLDGVARLAEPAELAAIEPGQRLICAAISHTADEAINRFDRLAPEWRDGKVNLVTRRSAEAGAHRVLYLRGTFSDSFMGSPIFNDQGRLVALYCEPAADENGKAETTKHYAKLIEPQVIQLGLSRPDDPFWVAPEMPPELPTKEEPAK